MKSSVKTLFAPLDSTSAQAIMKQPTARAERRQIEDDPAEREERHAEERDLSSRALGVSAEVALGVREVVVADRLRDRVGEQEEPSVLAAERVQEALGRVRDETVEAADGAERQHG